MTRDEELQLRISEACRAADALTARGLRVTVASLEAELERLRDVAPDPYAPALQALRTAAEETFEDRWKQQRLREFQAEWRRY